MTEDSSSERAADNREDAVSRATLSTLGMRLTQEAYRIAMRTMPTPVWQRPLEQVRAHLNSLPTPSETRFRRVEAQSFPYVATSEQASDEIAVQGGRSLSPSLQQRLREFVGPGTEAVRIHHDQFADRFARGQRADAVTMGQHVFLRQDRFRPDTDEGLALLAHETTHVLQSLRPNAAWRRATQGALQEEEQEAQRQEHEVLRARHSVRSPLAEPRLPLSATAPVVGNERIPVQVPSAPVPAASALSRPMTASVTRDPTGAPNVMPEATNLPNLDDLRRALYRDLMSQIKADLERGG